MLCVITHTVCRGPFVVRRQFGFKNIFIPSLSRNPIYINDLYKCLAYSTAFHFADDTNLLVIGKTQKQLQKHMNIDLKLLYKWLIANKISLNCSKTELIIFHGTSTDTNFEYKIKINGHKLMS